MGIINPRFHMPFENKCESAFSMYEFDYIPEIRRQTKLVHVSQS